MGVLAPFSSLLDFILPPRREALLVRDAEEDALARRMMPSYIEARGFECTGLVPYRDPLMRAAVHEWKYRGNKRAKRLLVALFAEYLLSSGGEAREHAVIVPVPLSGRRQRERGFNQCEVVASEALAVLGDTRASLDASLIARYRETEHQARLSRTERAHNVRNAFAPAKEADPLRTYLLFDDVVTTGATMQAASEALYAAGARRILHISLAY
jgi:ComF family protein